MKKVVLIILIIGLMVFGSFAQMNEMSFGVKAGLTLGKLSISEEIFGGADEKFRVGFAGGGMMVMPLNENMHIQGELMYVMKGEKLEDGGEEATIIIDVLEFPVLLKYMVNESMGFYGGPTLNYIMTAKMESPMGEDDWNDLTKDMSFGLSFGAQYKMDQILFDARYDLGLTDIVDDDSPSAPEIKLNTIYVTVGYLF